MMQDKAIGEEKYQRRSWSGQPNPGEAGEQTADTRLAWIGRCDQVRLRVGAKFTCK